MPGMTVTPILPAAAAVPTNGATSPADGLDPATGASAATDFAAVLKEQLRRPAREASDAEMIAAAILPEQADRPEDAAVTAPDLASLLPGLAALLQPTAPPAAMGEEAGAAAPDAVADALASSASAAGETVATAVEKAGAAPADDLTAPAARPRTGEIGTTIAPTQSAEAQRGEDAADVTEATAARQPAVLAVAQKATAETAAPASPAQDTHLPEPALEAPAMAASSAAASAHARQSAEAPIAIRVDTPVGTRGWDGEVGQKLLWLASRDGGQAELTLNPPHLGKVEVTISVNGDQTNALFVSASPTVRDALEQALPRLREMLADAGISLGQASVNAESPQRDDEGRGGRGGAGADGTAAASPATATANAWIRSGSGLIDIFA